MRLFLENDRYRRDDFESIFSGAEIAELLKIEAFKFSNEFYKANFVGSIVIGKHFLVFLPKFFKHPAKLDLKDIKLLQMLFIKFNSEKIENKSIEEQYVHHFSLKGNQLLKLYELYVSLKQDYLNYGLISHRVIEKQIGNKGCINWGKTSKRIPPIIADNGPVYDKYYITSKQTYSSYITRIHATTILKLANIFEPESFIKKSNFNIAILNDEELFSSYAKIVLQREMNIRFADREIKLLKALLAFSGKGELFQSNKILRSIFGTSYFWSVWETICKKLFMDSEIYRNMLPVIYYENKGVKQSLGKQRPDILTKIDDAIWVVDAKYYRNPINIPQADIIKQFKYAESLISKEKILNFFALPALKKGTFIQDGGKIYLDNEKTSHIRCLLIDPFQAIHFYLEDSLVNNLFFEDNFIKYKQL